MEWLPGAPVSRPGGRTNCSPRAAAVRGQPPVNRGRRSLCADTVRTEVSAQACPSWTSTRDLRVVTPGGSEREEVCFETLLGDLISGVRPFITEEERGKD